MNTTTASVQTVWDPILAGIRADALDCLQSTVAAIADEAFGPGSHLALGCRWRFPVREADGTVGVQPSVAERIGQAEEVFGLEVSEPTEPLDSVELRHMADTGRIYIVAEAYDLDWLPYSLATVRYREMPHSFLLERAGDGYTVVDAYYADTEWGIARPTVFTMSAEEFDAAMDGTGIAVRITSNGTPPQIDRDAVMRDNARTARAAGPNIDDYIEGARGALESQEGVDRLVLDVWHLCRERLLYTVWLGEHEAAPAVAAAAEAWQQLAGQSYLASRRARRGARPNPALVEDMARLLHADAALMSQIGGSAPAIDCGAVESTVRDVLGETLKLDPSTIEPSSALRTLAGFDSFRLVEVIDEVEARLGVEFPAEASAADLADVAGLCRLFVKAAEEGSP